MDELLDCIEAKDRERASQIFKALEGMKIYEAQLLLDACKGAFDVMEIQFHLAGRD